MSSTRIEELEAQNESLSRRLKSWVDARGKVWVVRFGNNFPAEVDSIWLTRELAEARAGDGNNGWSVEYWTVREGLPGEPELD